MIETHQFKLGNFNCTVINDGYITIGPTSVFFKGATKEELQQALDEHGLKAQSMTIPCSCILVDTGEHRILVDCGSGGEMGGYKEAELGYLLKGLESLDIQPDDITHVILSHGHFDHIAAIADDTGKPTFPNASYIMARDEWDYWVTETDDFSPMHRKLTGIKPQLHLVKPDADILDGVRVLYTPGHTYHHVAVEFESEGEVLLCPIDTMDHPLQGQHPTWGANWDVDSAKARESRERILKRSIEKDALVHGFHFPFPGLGKFRFDGTAWQWRAKK